MRLCRLLGGGICLAMLLIATENANAQQGQYVTQAATRLGKLIDKGNSEGFRLAANKFSLGGGWLAQGTEYVSLFTINLEAGKKYRFLAAGDDDARDVDIRVMDPSKNVVAEEAKTDATAEVDFTPKTSLRYLVQVRVFKSRAGGSGKQVPAFTIGTVMVGK